MLALVKTVAGPGLELRDVPMPAIGINDVLIRVHKTGICGTDLHIESWDPWAARTIQPPLVVGHEFVGEIVEVGSNVADFHPGDLVSGEGHVVCGRCRHCLAGRRHLCANTIGLGVGRDGAFAEYVALPMTNVWHHWPGVDEEVAAIFDPFGNAVHTALAFPVLGEDVLVSGAGPIGLMATAVARHAGARHVVVSEPNAYRRELALRMGATLVVDPTDRALPDVFAELDMVEGFDVVLEMSGNPTALRAAIAAMAHGGGDRDPRHPDRGDRPRRQRDRLQDAHHARHLRSRDVRDLVQDDGHAPVRAGHHARRSPTGSGSASTRPRSRRPAPATPARSSWTGCHERCIAGSCRAPRPARLPRDEVAALRERHLYRPLRVMSSAQGPIVSVDDRRLISLSSNDYLGLTHHPRVRDAAVGRRPRVRRRGPVPFGRSPARCRCTRPWRRNSPSSRGRPPSSPSSRASRRTPGSSRPSPARPTSSCRMPSTTPRSSTGCGCRRRRARSTHTPTSMPCARSSARRVRRAGPAAASGGRSWS